MLTCLQQPPYNNINMSTILPETRLYLLAYSNHLTITSTCLPYYQRHKYTYLPTATTLQKQPHVYHITRDTTVLTCLQNHLTITSTCLTYYQRHNSTNLPTATTLQLNPPVNHSTRGMTVLTCLQQPPYNNNHLSYYQRHNYTYLPTTTNLQ